MGDDSSEEEVMQVRSWEQPGTLAKAVEDNKSSASSISIKDTDRVIDGELVQASNV
jgi:hypothetical protein